MSGELLYRGKENIAHLPGNHPIELVRHDVGTNYFEEVDEIYILVCPA